MSPQYDGVTTVKLGDRPYVWSIARSPGVHIVLLVTLLTMHRPSVAGDSALSDIAGRAVAGSLGAKRTRPIALGIDRLHDITAEQLPDGDASTPELLRFPELPPAPENVGDSPLPPLDSELWHHGGSYLYCPEGDRLGLPHEKGGHADPLREPVDFIAPEPFTRFAEFMGADPINPSRHGWLGPGCYAWEPRFVGYGSYEVLGIALDQGGRTVRAMGHQLLVDLDLRLTGTERFHVQFRPLGRRNTGGSYYRFNSPSEYVDNSTGEPDRFWFEGEVHSILGWGRDPFASRYTNFLIGKFPYVLHNSLLLNDDIIGGAIGRNNLQWRSVSNLNVQLFAGLNDVDTYAGNETQIYGLHATIDFRRVFFEVTCAYLNAESGRDAEYAGFSRTKFYGPLSVATRALFKWGDEQGTGNGHLVTLETNWTRVFDRAPFGIEYAVFFCNAFQASEGWNSISGGNLNRLRTAFEVDPLVRLAAGPAQRDTLGVTLGAQLFRHHEDEMFIPEFAWESRGGDSVFGYGVRYQRKTGRRSFVELFGLHNWSDNTNFARKGVFASHTWLF